MKSRKYNREQAINIVINRLDAMLLSSEQQLVLNINAVKRMLKSRVRFQTPIYKDLQVFYQEFEKDLNAFVKSVEQNSNTYPINDLQTLKDELFSLMESFFKRGPIGSFFSEFPLLTTIITATIPGLLISIINLFIKK